ncbi:hypothetical protein IF1G_10893 [Cordyceps javanica]|uniref:Uncharacterized protein n=1 Tax=Cordyceps javanica TaxID=43265 RepID=A0A545ULS5_9HYPO|nr:hypothetical protein IF1G_10893 [Cordyceps javanica]
MFQGQAAGYGFLALGEHRGPSGRIIRSWTRLAAEHCGCLNNKTIDSRQSMVAE